MRLLLLDVEVLGLIAKLLQGSPENCLPVRGQPFQATRRRHETCQEGAVAMNKTWVGRSQVQIPVPAKFSLAKSPLNITCFSTSYT